MVTSPTNDLSVQNVLREMVKSSPFALLTVYLLWTLIQIILPKIELCYQMLVNMQLQTQRIEERLDRMERTMLFPHP